MSAPLVDGPSGMRPPIASTVSKGLKSIPFGTGVCYTLRAAVPLLGEVKNH